jgi:hypothetical protein
MTRRESGRVNWQFSFDRPMWLLKMAAPPRVDSRLYK